MQTIHALMRPLIIVALLVAAAPGADAQQPRPSKIEILFAQTVSQGTDFARYMVQWREEFRQLDQDGDGVITAADTERSRARMAAALRANTVSEMLSRDLDGDGVVTREEVVRLESHNMRLGALNVPGLDPAVVAKQLDLLVATRMAADRNRDGRIDGAEILAHAKAQVAGRQVPVNERIAMALTLDQDGDGKVTRAEFEQAAERIFLSIHPDRDGKVTKEEVDAYQQRTNPRAAPRSAAAAPLLPPPPPAVLDRKMVREMQCAMPPVPDGARVVMLSAFHGAGLSTVAIGSQDVATSTARVTVEPGREPLYLVLLGVYPVIWQFDGAVERVAKAVLISQHSGNPNSVPRPGAAAGATGLSRDVVAFAPTDCIRPFFDIPSMTSAQAKGAVRRRAGREPEVVVASDRLRQAMVPSGRLTVPRDPSQPVDIVRRPQDRGTTRLRTDLARNHPAGVVKVDAAQVVAGLPVQDYEVLPSEAGLLQLLEEGQLEPGRNGEFVVRAPMRYPADLFGASSARFLVPRGVPAPQGDPGHSCVYSEETGRAISKTSCE